jgi:hypothetical protein
METTYCGLCRGSRRDGRARRVNAVRLLYGVCTMPDDCGDEYGPMDQSQLPIIGIAGAVVWLVSSAIAAFVADDRNLSAGGFFCLGLLIGPIAIVAAFLWTQPQPPLAAPAPAPGRRAVHCLRCDALQNIKLAETSYECWRCHERVEV